MRFVLALTLFVPTLALAQAADSSDPVKVVEGFTSTMSSVLKDAEQLGFRGRYERLQPAIEHSFDLDFMSEKSLGSHWQKLTPEQQQTWRQAFQRYMVSNYASRLNHFNNQTFEQLGQEQAAGDTLLIKTRIHDPGEEDVDLNYRLRKTDAGWRIVDVIARGAVSELAVRRSDYTNVLKNQGFDALLANVNQKVADMEAGKAG